MLKNSELKYFDLHEQEHCRWEATCEILSCTETDYAKFIFYGNNLLDLFNRVCDIFDLLSIPKGTQQTTNKKVNIQLQDNYGLSTKDSILEHLSKSKHFTNFSCAISKLDNY